MPADPAGHADRLYLQVLVYLGEFESARPVQRLLEQAQRILAECSDSISAGLVPAAGVIFSASHGVKQLLEGVDQQRWRGVFLFAVRLFELVAVQQLVKAGG